MNFEHYSSTNEHFSQATSATIWPKIWPKIKTTIQTTIH